MDARSCANKLFICHILFVNNLINLTSYQVNMQIVWCVRGGGDRVCHHDGVGYIETDVVTYENLQTTVHIIYKGIMISINIKNHLRTTLQREKSMIIFDTSVALQKYSGKFEYGPCLVKCENLEKYYIPSLGRLWLILHQIVSNYIIFQKVNSRRVFTFTSVIATLISNFNCILFFFCYKYFTFGATINS